jgi:hypothetical protein
MPPPKEEKMPEIDQNHLTQINFIKKNLKTDLM